MFKPNLFLGGGHSGSAWLSKQVLQSGPARSWCVSSGHALPTCWASLGTVVELLGPMVFSGKDVSFSFLLVSSRRWNAPLFSSGCAGWAALPSHRVDQPSTL
jgi:hypothetical protein